MEGSLPDRLHAPGNRDLPHHRAVFKQALADLRQPLGQVEMGNLGAVMVGSVRNSFSRIFNRQKALPPPTNIPQEVKGISESAIIPQPEAELEPNQPQQVEAPEIIPPGSVIPGIISHETRNSFIPRVTVDEKAVIAQMEARKQEQQQQGIEQGDGQTPQEPNDFLNDFQMD